MKIYKRILELRPSEFLFLGTGCVATLKPADGKGRVGILSIDEYDGLQPLRRLGGDEDHQGRRASPSAKPACSG